MIKVEHVTKYYGEFKALDDISFEIPEGQVVGFLGPNGAGKTTTLKILTCNAFPHSGRVSIAGFDVTEHPMEVQARIGYLPESAPLYREMLVWEYLDFMGEARGMSKRERLKAIERVAEQTGIAERLNQPISELSKGFRQRVGLAQAIMHEPQVLILDEPYTGLDPIQIIEIRNLIKEYGRNHTVFLSSHILQEVEATSDRIIVINAGRIVADGNVRELLGHDTLVAHVEGPAGLVVKAIQETGDLVVVGDSNTDKGVEVRISVKGMDLDEGAALVFDTIREHGWRMLRLEPGRMTFEDLFVSLMEGNRSSRNESSGGEEQDENAESVDNVSKSSDDSSTVKGGGTEDGASETGNSGEEEHDKDDKDDEDKE